MTRRRHITASPAMIAGLATAACGAPPAAIEPAAATKPTRQPVTVRLNYRTENYIAERSRDFSAANPWITVELIPNTGYQKLLVVVASGEVGDVMWDSVGVGAYLQLASQGHLRTIDPLASRDKFDLRQYFPRTIETARLDGKVYGLPATTHPGTIGLFYNQTMFEQAGLKLPTLDWTADDLVTAARRLTSGANQESKADAWGVQFQTSYTALVCVLRTFGGEYTDPPSFGKQPAIDRPPAKQALQWLYDLIHRHRVAPSKQAGKVSFVDGNLGMWQGITGNISMVKQVGDRFKMGVSLIPKGPGGKRGSMIHFGLLAMSGKSRYPDEAWEVQKWLTNKESALRQAKLDSGIPGARPDAWNDPQPMQNNPLFKVFKEFMEHPGPGSLPVPWNFKMPQIQQLSDESLAPLWTGEQSVDQVSAATVGPLRALLEQPR